MRIGTRSDRAGGTTSRQPTDAQLLDSTRRGDRDAYAVLYERYRRLAYATVAELRIQGDREADDIVSDAFLKIFDALITKQRDIDTFGAYLVTTVRNIAFSRLKASARFDLHDGIEFVDRAEPFDDTVLAAFESSRLVAAFEMLPPRWREVIWFTLVLGWKPAQVAAELDMSPNAVSSLAMRAREGLRQNYLQAHLSVDAGESCHDTVTKLGLWIRGGLSAREARRVSDHLDGCESCRALATELDELNQSIRSAGLIILLASPAVPLLLRRSMPHAASGSAAATGGTGSAVGVSQIVAAATIALAAAGVGVMLTSGQHSRAATRDQGPRAAAVRDAPSPGATLPALPADTPLPARTLGISALGVTATIVPAAVRDGVLEPPAAPTAVGLWAGSAALDARSGQLTISGHASLPGATGFAFADLARLKPGSEIVTSDEHDLETRWTVTVVRDRHKADGVEPAAFAGRSGRRSLVLITCGGVASDGSYADNIYVYAIPSTRGAAG